MSQLHIRDYASLCNHGETVNAYKTIWSNGSLIEFRKYRLGIKHGYRRRFSPASKTEKRKGASRDFSIIRSIDKVRLLINSNFGVNHYFLTFTFDPKIHPWIYDKDSYSKVPYYWKIFTQAYFDKVLKKPDLKYLAVPEFISSKRNHWHIHVLINKKPFVGVTLRNFIEGSARMTQYWGQGRTSIELIKSLRWWKWRNLTPSADTLSRYVCKYMVKNIGANVFPLGRRRYYPSKNLIKPKVLYGDYDPMKIDSAPKDRLVTTVKRNFDHVGEVEVSKVHLDIPWYLPLLHKYVGDDSSSK